MCLAIPAQVESIDGRTGTVVLDDNRSEVVLTLVPEAKWRLGPRPRGYAITVLDEKEARETYDLLKEAEGMVEVLLCNS